MRRLFASVVVLGAIGCGPSSTVIPTTDDSAAVVLPAAPLELCVNEFMADNATGWRDELGAISDWVELHNNSDATVFLDGWTLTDDPGEPDKHPLDGLQIAAGDFLVLAADNAPALGPAHLSFGLSTAGESIGLYRGDGTGEVLSWGPTTEDFSWARVSDCCADPAACAAPRWLGTPGASNAP